MPDFISEQIQSGIHSTPMLINPPCTKVMPIEIVPSIVACLNVNFGTTGTAQQRLC